MLRGIVLANYIKILAATSIVLIAMLLGSIFTQEVSAEEIHIHRFWSNNKQSHFYTGDEKERDEVIVNYDDDQWDYERIGFTAYKKNATTTGTTNIHRFWSDLYNSHFYTASTAEKNYIQNTFPDEVWKYEGVAFKAATKSNNNDLVPVYRFWSETKKSHFYTTSKAEKNNIIQKFSVNVWKYENIAFYVIPFDRADKPRMVTSGCPGFNEACIPCWADDSRCRISGNEGSGFLGWSCQNNNPGNIRFSDYRNNIIENYGGEKSCGERGTFMVFETPITGRNALKAYIRGIADGAHFAYPDCGDCNLKYFFSKYAPAGDQNDPNSYANNTASWIRVDPDKTTLNWIVNNRLDEFAAAIQRQEGWFAN